MEVLDLAEGKRVHWRCVAPSRDPRHEWVGTEIFLRVVSQFCAANDAFVLEQSRRIAATRTPAHVTVTTLKVGVVRTGIRRQFPLWMKLAVPLLFDAFLSRSPEQIAASARRLLLGPEFEGVTGALFLHIRCFKSLPPGQRAGDPAQGRQLWDFSKQLVAQARAAGAPKESRASAA
jgi:hypothetical protein